MVSRLSILILMMMAKKAMVQPRKTTGKMIIAAWGKKRKDMFQVSSSRLPAPASLPRTRAPSLSGTGGKALSLSKIFLKIESDKKAAGGGRIPQKR